MARIRPADSLGESNTLYGEYRLAVTSGLATVVAAGDATAGHVFVMRNPSTTKRAIIRYVNVNFVTTTGFGTIQPMAYDLIVARAYTASHTGGTAIDMGSTVTNTGKLRTNQPTSLFTANTCRIATTAGLTAGTHVLDANPLSRAGGAGTTTIASAFDALLLDARNDGIATYSSPITLAQDEGIVVRNVILMGATGVGYITVNVEWDEVA